MRGEVQGLGMLGLNVRFGSGRRGGIGLKAPASAFAGMAVAVAAIALVVIGIAIAIAIGLGTAARLLHSFQLQETAAKLVATPSLELQQLATPPEVVVCEGLLGVEAPLTKTSAAVVPKQAATFPPSESVGGPYSVEVGDPWSFAVVLAQGRWLSDWALTKSLVANRWISCCGRRIGTLRRRCHFS